MNAMTEVLTVSPDLTDGAVKRAVDVETEFDRLWLDESMAQSCAFWELGDTLDSAQRRNREWHIAESGASGARRVLEIGCGWGFLLSRLVNAHGVEQAVGLTESRVQAEHVASLGFPTLRVHQESWEQHRPSNRYDSIVSIGGFQFLAAPGLGSEEKVARFRDFLLRCRSWLEPGGRLSLQTIAAAGDIREEFAPFFESYTPASALPTLAEILRASEGLFSIETKRNDPGHYARTLHEWGYRLLARKGKALTLVGEETVERYERYFHNAARSFEAGFLMLLRIGLRRLDS